MHPMRCGLVHALSLVVLIGAPARASTQEPGEPVDAALASRGLAPGALRADVIVAWNALTHDLAVAEDQFLTFKGQRALAMVHLAMHDALNAIVPAYDRYAHTGRPRLGHPVAAAAQAAHDVLVAQYPDKTAAIDAELARWLSGIAPGALRESGLAIGKDAAAAVTAARLGDGWDVPGTVRVHRRPGRPLPDDAAVERVRCPARVPNRQAVRPRVPAPVPAGAPAAAEVEGLCGRVP